MEEHVSPREQISIAVVEDDAGFRESLVSLIGTRSDFRFAGAFASAEEALDSLKNTPPRVLLLDIRLPGESGSRAVKKFVELFPGIVVLMLTQYLDDDVVFEALCGGASGYLLKRTAPPRLLEAVVDACDGGAP
ncbi:MAG TPA: response regulator transcription factor, partial [Thermoanaerobaculia bacterium]|nr:response regulator transcription factor [Thermoanaerobaculia bacterium]